MIELKKACKVPYPKKLYEEYEICDNAISANVSTSKVIDMMKAFIRMHDKPTFFILELPKRADGSIVKKVQTDKELENDVYYIDGMDEEKANLCLDEFGELLVEDGMSIFGIGCHRSHDEILFGKYNVLTIYSNEVDKFSELMRSFEIKKTEKLVTAWDTFDRNHPGECTTYVSNKIGYDIYDIPERGKKYGMYLYEKPAEVSEDVISREELIGKVLLVGITYYTNDGELIEQKQYYGNVTEASDTLIRIKLKDGSCFTLPPDLSSTKRARPGKYTLRSTGEVVSDPDFLATWNMYKGE